MDDTTAPNDLPPAQVNPAVSGAPGSALPPPPPPSLDTIVAVQPAADPPRRGRLLAAVAATALIASAAGAGAVALVTDDDSTSTAPAAQVSTNIEPLTSRPAAALDTPSIVAKTAPSVVSIHTTIQGAGPLEQQITEEGTGTGFIASADGLIYTNAHVVADATDVNVTLADGTTKAGKVVGVDTTDDLAVVKIDASGLTPLAIGSSADMRVGDPVVAVGNALALPGGPTATQGIISALNRTIDTNNGEHLAKLIQTDAAINPGNSGGPLLNAQGQVIAINTAGATDAENVGFAIALDTAKPILEELAQGKKHVKAFLGVQTQDVDPAFAEQNGLSVQSGAYVVAVTAESGAEVAGIKVGDVITKIDDTAIASSSDVGAALAGHQPDDAVKVTVRRGDKDVELTAHLGSRQA